MSQIKVKPAEGRKVRNPEQDNEFLPDEGDVVTHSEYWARRFNDGDVTVIEVGTPPVRKRPDAKEA